VKAVVIFATLILLMAVALGVLAAGLPGELSGMRAEDAVTEYNSEMGAIDVEVERGLIPYLLQSKINDLLRQDERAQADHNAYIQSQQQALDNQAAIDQLGIDNARNRSETFNFLARAGGLAVIISAAVTVTGAALAMIMKKVLYAPKALPAMPAETVARSAPRRDLPQGQPLREPRREQPEPLNLNVDDLRYCVNGNGVNGHSTNGHSVNGHGANVHGSNGHGPNGHQPYSRVNR
jgi:hypothetical protein